MIKFDTGCPNDVVDCFIEDTDVVYRKLSSSPIIYHNGFPVSQVPREILEKHVGILQQHIYDISEQLGRLSRVV